MDEVAAGSSSSSRWTTASGDGGPLSHVSLLLVTVCMRAVCVPCLASCPDF